MKICQKCNFSYKSSINRCPNCDECPLQEKGFMIYAPEFGNIQDGFKSSYYSDLASLESSNFWFLARNEIIEWALKKYAANSNNFLEIGCGTGFVLSMIEKNFSELEVYGSEVFVEGLMYAKTRLKNAKLMQMDARRIPFISEFDCVGAFDVIEHIHDDDIVLSQLNKALNINGILILSVPQHKWLWSNSDDYACHARRYSNKELNLKLLASGFKILRSTSFVSTLLPILIVSRFLNKLKKNNYNPLNELKVPRFINLALFNLLKFELILIKLGLNFSMGGSRLVVAMKVNSSEKNTI